MNRYWVVAKQGTRIEGRLLTIDRSSLGAGDAGGGGASSRPSHEAVAASRSAQRRWYYSGKVAGCLLCIAFSPAIRRPAQ